MQRTSKPSQHKPCFGSERRAPVSARAARVLLARPCSPGGRTTGEGRWADEGCARNRRRPKPVRTYGRPQRRAPIPATRRTQPPTSMRPPAGAGAHHRRRRGRRLQPPPAATPRAGRNRRVHRHRRRHVTRQRGGRHRWRSRAPRRWRSASSNPTGRARASPGAMAGAPARNAREASSLWRPPRPPRRSLRPRRRADSPGGGSAGPDPRCRTGIRRRGMASMPAAGRAAARAPAAAEAAGSPLCALAIHARRLGRRSGASRARRAR